MLAQIPSAFSRRQDRGSRSLYLTGKYVAFYVTEAQYNLLRLESLAKNISFQKHMRERLQVSGFEHQGDLLIDHAIQRLFEAWNKTLGNKNNQRQDLKLLFDSFVKVQFDSLVRNGISPDFSKEIMEKFRKAVIRRDVCPTL